MGTTIKNNLQHSFEKTGHLDKSGLKQTFLYPGVEFACEILLLKQVICTVPYKVYTFINGTDLLMFHNALA